MPQKETLAQYDCIITGCKDIFLKKTEDYGTSWRVLRPISVTDQIMIKALRIRHIQETGSQKVEDKIDAEFRGIINYGIIALIQLSLPPEDRWELSLPEAEESYDRQVTEIRNLMINKNHDYGEAWRQMSEQSFVDLILSKLQRIRMIIANQGRTKISEGIESNFADIVNYAVFALILMENETKEK